MMRKAIRLLAAAVVLAVGAGAFAQSSANDALFAAAKSGTAEDVRAAIKAGSDVNAKDENGISVLAHAAARNTRVDVIKTLLKSGADVNAQMPGGVTVLIAAMFKQNQEVIKLLVSAGADVNARLVGGFSALMLAAICSNIDAIKVLSDAGANMNARFEGGLTALMFAALMNSPEVIKAFLSERAKLTDVNDIADADLFINTILSKNADTIKALIAAGADVNAKMDIGISALMLASYVGNFDAIKVLTASKADVSLKDERGMKAIDYLKSNPANAKAEGYWEICDLLY